MTVQRKMYNLPVRMRKPSSGCGVHGIYEKTNGKRSGLYRRVPHLSCIISVAEHSSACGILDLLESLEAVAGFGTRIDDFPVSHLPGL